MLSCVFQDGVEVCNCCYSTWWQNSKTEDENGSSTPKVQTIWNNIYYNCHWYNLKILIFLISLVISFRFFDLFEKFEGYKTGKLKLKKPKQLQVNTFKPVFEFPCSIVSDWIYLRHLTEMHLMRWNALFLFWMWQEVLDIARQLLVELGQNNDSEIEESKAKLEQLKTVLEMWVIFTVHSWLLVFMSFILILFPVFVQVRSLLWH